MRRILGLAVLALGGCVVVHDPVLPRPAEPPLTREEATRFVAAGLSEGVIGERIDAQGVEPLDADALAALKKAGASDALLQKLILAAKTPPPPERAVYVDDGPYYYYGYRPIYTSVGVGFGFGYGYSHSRVCRPSRGIRIYR